jgi:hypothetical protein
LNSRNGWPLRPTRVWLNSTPAPESIRMAIAAASSTGEKTTSARKAAITSKPRLNTARQPVRATGSTDSTG